MAYYCFVDSDSDAVTAFQVYADAEASRVFLQADSYRAYVAEVKPLLIGPPQVKSLTPVWAKA